MPTIIKNGIQYNINPNVVGASELTVTTPEVEIVGKTPLFDSRHSAFNRNELIKDIDKIMGNTVGKVLEPITKVPGVIPVLRTLTPSNWVGTIRMGVAPWSKNNEGFGTSENDQALNSLFNYGVIPSIGSPMLKGIGKTVKSTYNIVDKLPTGFRPTMQYAPNTLYRLIGVGDKGYKDLLQSGIVRGNMHPRGIFTSKELHRYMRNLSNKLNESDLRAFSSDNYANETQFNRINEALKQLSSSVPDTKKGIQLHKKTSSIGTWEEYLKSQKSFPTIEFANVLFSNRRRNPWLQNWIDYATGGVNRAIAEVEWSNLPTFATEQSEVLNLLKQDVRKGSYVGDYGITISNANKYATPFTDGGHLTQHPTTKVPVTLDNPDLAVYKLKRGLLSRKPYMVKVSKKQIKKDLAKLQEK